VLKHAYIDDPLDDPVSRRGYCWLQPESSVLRTRKLTVTVQRSLLAHTCGHVSCRSLF